MTTLSKHLDCFANEVVDAIIKESIKPLTDQINVLTAELEAAKKEIEWLKFLINNAADGYANVVTSQQSQISTLKAALEDLLDVQNGPPLVRDTEKWEEIVARGYKLLALKESR